VGADLLRPPVSDVVRAVSIRPNVSACAPITFALTTYAGLEVHAALQPTPCTPSVDARRATRPAPGRHMRSSVAFSRSPLGPVARYWSGEDPNPCLGYAVTSPNSTASAHPSARTSRRTPHRSRTAPPYSPSGWHPSPPRNLIVRGPGRCGSLEANRLTVTFHVKRPSPDTGGRTVTTTRNTFRLAPLAQRPEVIPTSGRPSGIPATRIERACFT
jgi:hypothetical protein